MRPTSAGLQPRVDPGYDLLRLQEGEMEVQLTRVEVQVQLTLLKVQEGELNLQLTFFLQLEKVVSMIYPRT